MLSSDHPWKTIPLFGGALQTVLPENIFRDVSDFFPIEDNQEVYQHIHAPDVVFTVELLEREDHVDNTKAAFFFFEDLVKTEATAIGKIQQVKEYQSPIERTHRYPSLFGITTPSTTPKGKEEEGLPSTEASDRLSNAFASISLTTTTNGNAMESSSKTLPLCEYICEVHGIKHAMLEARNSKEAKDSSLIKAEEKKKETNTKEKEKEEGMEEANEKEERETKQKTKWIKEVSNVHMAVFRFTGSINTDIVVSLAAPSSTPVLSSADEDRLWEMTLKKFCVLNWDLFL